MSTLLAKGGDLLLEGLFGWHISAQTVLQWKTESNPFFIATNLYLDLYLFVFSTLGFNYLSDFNSHRARA